MSAFKAEVIQRLEEVEKKQQVLPEILAVVKSIEARLDHQNDSHLPPAERPADQEDEESVNSLVIMDALSGDSDSQDTPDNLEDDKAIREGIAAKRKTLTNIQTRAAQLNQQIDEENRRRDRSPNRIHKLKVEKYRLLDKEDDVKEKEQRLKIALGEWTKRCQRKSLPSEPPSQGRTESPRRKSRRSSPPPQQLRHHNSPSPARRVRSPSSRGPAPSRRSPKSFHRQETPPSSRAVESPRSSHSRKESQHAGHR
ncbi:unnamed protein product [Heligmosomoides polygyrus]|uniref:PRP21_like_P domain-containing protein n=1 Tax=Heligmosomoides polygyrus TaxID=6339 RepID=A0A183F4T5_HELPZ|nr:unnamed protein product [Heligmosomoides polygyrus]